MIKDSLEEMGKAVMALFLELPESIAKDVKTKYDRLYNDIKDNLIVWHNVDNCKGLTETESALVLWYAKGTGLPVVLCGHYQVEIRGENKGKAIWFLDYTPEVIYPQFWAKIPDNLPKPPKGK